MLTPCKPMGERLGEASLVVALVAAMATLAVPTPAPTPAKSLHADAREALLQLQLEQERYRATHPAYARTLGAAADGLALPGAVGHHRLSPLGEYTLSVVSASANAYSLRADANGPLSRRRQAPGDPCAVLSLTVSALGESREPARCW